MKAFIAVLALAASASAASVLPSSTSPATSPRHLQVFGSPALTRMMGESPAVAAADMDGVLGSEADGWRSLYDKPFILAVQQDNKPELAAFLVKGGLASLPNSEDMGFLHNALRSADDKVGILLSATKFVTAPQVEMPITKFFLPKDYTLATSARLQSQNRAFPTMLLLKKADLKGFDLAKLAMIGDFNIFDDSVKIGADIATPAASSVYRVSNSDLGMKRVVQAASIHPVYGAAADVTTKLGPYGYDYIIPSGFTIGSRATEISKYLP